MTEYCRCTEPLIKCDDKGCRCFSCGLPEKGPIEIVPELPPEIRPLVIGQTYRHRKTGGFYAVVDLAVMQTVIAELDMHEVVLYRSHHDSLLWVRTVDEFMDGRFEYVGSQKE